MASVPRAEGASPAMAQWFAAKAEHPEALVFFRMGDFYELFFADAEAAAAALDIALTQRGEHGGAPIPMCGVPYHAAEAYLARLIRRGFRVAVTEQMEDPKTRNGKGPIRREVVRLITPGTVTEDALLDAGRPNLLLALAQDQQGIGAAWLDVSTGLFETSVLLALELPALLGRLEPAEILAPTTIALGDWSDKLAPEPVASPPLVARRRLAEAFGAASLARLAARTLSDPDGARRETGSRQAIRPWPGNGGGGRVGRPAVRGTRASRTQVSNRASASQAAPILCWSCARRLVGHPASSKASSVRYPGDEADNLTIRPLCRCGSWVL